MNHPDPMRKAAVTALQEAAVSWSQYARHNKREKVSPEIFLEHLASSEPFLERILHYARKSDV